MTPVWKINPIKLWHNKLARILLLAEWTKMLVTSATTTRDRIKIISMKVMHVVTKFNYWYKYPNALWHENLGNKVQP